MVYGIETKIEEDKNIFKVKNLNEKKIIGGYKFNESTMTIFGKISCFDSG